MRYSVTLIGLGAALVLLSLQVAHAGFLLVWIGIDFVILGVAHLRGAHGVFGKRADGTLPLWSWIVFLPLLTYTALVWHLIRLLSREPKINQLSDDLHVGRRLIASEPPGEFANYVDLTAEFQEPQTIRKSAGYVAFPILDASAPMPESLAQAVSRLKPGKTFIHCAQGHGRTGLFALAVMLQQGKVQSVEEGLELLAAARPAVRLSPTQLHCIRMYAEQLRS